MYLMYSTEVWLFFSISPKNTNAFALFLAHVEKFCCWRTWALAFTPIHSHFYFPLLWNWWPPKYCFNSPKNRVDGLLVPSEATATTYIWCTPCGVAVSLCKIKPCSCHLCSLLKHHMRGHLFHNNDKVEMAVHEWLQQQEPSVYCNRILNSH